MLGFKPLEIIVIVFALLIPVGAFAVALIPGAYGAILEFSLKKENAPVVFGGLALIAFAVLAWRIYRRIRPAPRKPADTYAPPKMSEFWRSQDR